jgi:hypothetical protein
MVVGSMFWFPADVAVGVPWGPAALLSRVREDVAAGALSEGGEAGGKVNC